MDTQTYELAVEETFFTFNKLFYKQILNALHKRCE